MNSSSSNLFINRCCCCCSVIKWCLTFCNPMDCRVPGFLSFTTKNQIQSHMVATRWRRAMSLKLVPWSERNRRGLGVWEMWWDAHPPALIQCPSAAQSTFQGGKFSNLTIFTPSFLSHLIPSYFLSPHIT